MSRLSNLLLKLVFVASIFSIPEVYGQTPIEMPTGKRFFVQSAMNYGQNNGGCWDIPNTPVQITKGSNIQIWDLDGGTDRIFTLLRSSVQGFYEIMIGNTQQARVNIDGGKTANGTNVEAWDRDGKPKQFFRFQHMGNGRFKIFDINGKVLCLADRSNHNGANVHIWDNHDGPWMEWYLIDVQTKKAYVPQSEVVSVTKVNDSNSSILYRFEEAEDMVYGKVGLFDDGSVKYTFAIIRKPNKTKEVYRAEFDDPYGPRILTGGSVMKVNSKPNDYDQYDYWVIFNGQKMGPYDRIYEMHQDEPNVDKWVSADGKYISFSAVKGQKYAAIIGNKEVTSFWNFSQAPAYDPDFGKNTYAMQWSKDDTRLVENGIFKLKGWKVIENVSYSDNGQNLLYVGAETNKDERFVYLNHQKIGGPYYLVSNVGFVPGTDKPYIDGFNHRVVNGVSIYSHGFVQIGDRKIPIPDNYSVSPLYFAGQWVSFAVDKTNKEYKGSDTFKRKTVWIYEYNCVTDELLKHEGYAHVVITDVLNGKFIYNTFNANGDKLLVKQGGKLLSQMNRKDYGENAPFFRVGPNDDVFTFNNMKFMGPYTIILNGKPFTSVGNQIMEIGLSTRLNPTNGKIQMHIRKDRSLDGTKNKFINGNASFDFEGWVADLSVTYAVQSDDIFFATKNFDAKKDVYFEIFKNGKLAVDGQWYSITPLEIAPDGSHFATLVSDLHSSGVIQSYNTLNQNMNYKRILVLDGKQIGDSYGIPVWSNAKHKFLTLQATDGIIKMVEL
ncbi:MAG: RICIN domain-containing protein [Bacteroidales bacterium]